MEVAEVRQRAHARVVGACFITPASQAPFDELPPWFSTITLRPSRVGVVRELHERIGRALCFSASSPPPPALTRIEWQPRYAAQSSQRKWFSTAFCRSSRSRAPSAPSPST
jgi:hypothetical protein